MSTADYNARVVEVLKAAMRMEGMEGNKSAFARLLRGRVGDGPAPNTVGRWLRGEQTIPAWALVACAEAVQTDLGELLGLEAPASSDQLQQMRRGMEAMQRRVEELAAQLADVQVEAMDRASATPTTEQDQAQTPRRRSRSA
jgi:hypothetical protein